ncbi:MAG TPA: carboxypeptidase M32 [Rhizomicrobium sp.]|nr:carboxypeptidase M32 [Rhizomicrobium sp.]
MSRYLAARHGLRITHADPCELEVRDGDVFHEGERVDVAYRDYEMRDLIALEKELGRPLDGMRLLFRENRVVSSLAGDLDHKSGFEILTDPALAERFFSPDDCRLFHRHVLWTRLVSDRITSLPNNATDNLLKFARRHRDELVLKPNRGYGGKGVAIGAATTQADWDQLLDEAARHAADPDRSWVVQAATRLPVTEFPVLGPNGRVFSEPFYVVMGFAPTDNGLGVLCRVSQKQVVNVAQHGGLAAVLVAEPLQDLRIPRRPVKAAVGVLEAFRKRIVELRHLRQTISLLEWDEETKLPLRGRLQRGEQIATLETICHERLSSDEFGDLIAETAILKRGDAKFTRELYLLGRERKQAMALPEGIVRNFANAKSQALAAWEEARTANDFSIFALPFSQLLTVVRDRADCLAGDGDRYDALLDEHEPGITQARLEPLLRDLRNRLIPLVQHAADRAPRPASAPLHLAVEKQWALSRRLLQAIGFDFDRGRLDATTHPFTIMTGDDDVRVAGRVSDEDFSGAIFTTLHEGGHALYDQGFNPDDRDTLLADGSSSAMHEGLARLWENHVGRSEAFMEFLLPKLQKLAGNAPWGDARSLWTSLNQIRPGANRVRADEITYHLHIALRFELELLLLEDGMAVSALPEAWNARSRQFLGVTPASDGEGVLQDVHWAVGMFGYFPSYTIGSLYAAQLIETYRIQNDFEGQMRKGDFGPLRIWLNANVCRLGSSLPSEEIIMKTTGRGLDPSAFVSYVTSPERAWNAD